MSLRDLATLALAAWLALAPATGRADAALSEVRERLEQPRVLRGQFEQEKILQGFRNPLRSRGSLLLLRERGIAWDTNEPFPSSAVLTREHLISELPDGSRQVLLDAADGPAASATASLLMALVAGDLDALAQRFDIEASLLPEGGWTLGLVPREPGLQRVFARLQLAGDRYVRDVHIVESGGDTTRIRLIGLGSEPSQPTPAEAARFD